MRTPSPPAALLLLVAVADALRCKCTKESETVKCRDGVCSVDEGACLMLDHPTMGVHYTCHVHQMSDGDCRTKTTKSGVEVRICGCDSRDFCNFLHWPDRVSTREAEKEVAAPQTTASSASSLLLTAPVAFLLHFRLR